ncbi:hypothetical protein BDC45DRAFT_576056 [Circinella umbellata]|nr:hypothetical protein BDC45DRAFT_576056 [Circinella umbellata]
MSNNNNNENNAFINWILTQDPSSVGFSQQQQQFPQPQQQQQTCSTMPPTSNCQIPLANPEILPYILDGSTPSANATTNNIPNAANYPLLPSTVPMEAPVPTGTISSSSDNSTAPNPHRSPVEDFKTEAAITFGNNSGCNNSSNNNQKDSSYLGNGGDMKNHPHRSDDDEDYLSESQLKMMTSKERRQLRNKISARKFRNRRKEYISMLEAEVQKQKAENNQLRLEVTFIRTTADKLQKENDQLRLDLALCRKGIKSNSSTNNNEDSVDNGQNNKNTNNTTTTIMAAAHTVPSSNRSSSLSPPSLNNSSFNDSSNGSTSDCSSSTSSNNNPSPPELIDQWDLVFNDNQLINYPMQPQQQLQVQQQQQPFSSTASLPSQQQQQQQQQYQQQYYPYHNTYLAHAAMPDWDLHEILKKEKDESITSNDLFHKYPLLAPALMSIVLGHTMSMTTEDLVSNTKLLPPPSDPLFMPPKDELPRFHPNELFFGPKIGSSNSSYNNMSKKFGILTGEDFRSIWEAQQEHYNTMDYSLDDWNPEEEDETDDKKEIVYVRIGNGDNGLPKYCPLNWIQRQFCKFVYDYVIAKYPHLETPAQQYLPLCDKFRRQQMITMA